jgi:glycosyltransferase involved in cell wall biosynthesis
VFPSRLEALKRQPLVVEAMRHTKTPVRLILVGGGPDEPMLREMIAKHGLQQKIELAGRLPDEQLYELYLNALGVYYGPFDEDYGYVTIEGFAAHRPVVTTTDAGGPLEFVTDHQTGFVTPPEPEQIVSLPPRDRTTSSPPNVTITSSPRVPVISSRPDVPTIVAS